MCCHVGTPGLWVNARQPDLACLCCTRHQDTCLTWDILFLCHTVSVACHSYCECFASGRYCDNCNCLSCFNNKDNEAVRQAAVESILERNPNAFRPKIQVCM
jgi:hypothetical protein